MSNQGMRQFGDSRASRVLGGRLAGAVLLAVTAVASVAAVAAPAAGGEVRAVAINCPPPTSAVGFSRSGNPGC